MLQDSKLEFQFRTSALDKELEVTKIHLEISKQKSFLLHSYEKERQHERDREKVAWDKDIAIQNRNNEETRRNSQAEAIRSDERAHMRNMEILSLRPSRR